MSIRSSRKFFDFIIYQLNVFYKFLPYYLKLEKYRILLLFNYDEITNEQHLILIYIH